MGIKEEDNGDKIPSVKSSDQAMNKWIRKFFPVELTVPSSGFQKTLESFPPEFDLG